MDTERESDKLIRMLGLLLVFLYATFASLQELRFATQGKLTLGRITSVRWTTGRSRYREAAYDYRNAAGELWHARDSVSNDYVPPADMGIAIEFVDDGSRIAGHRNWLAIIAFFGSLFAVAASGILFWRRVRSGTESFV